jgi:hypothetical protein
VPSSLWTALNQELVTGRERPLFRAEGVRDVLGMNCPVCPVCTAKEWLPSLDSNYAALLSASILRNQLVNGFQLALV